MSTSGVTTPLEIALGDFARVLSREPVTFGHTLVGEPLLHLDVIAERADEWPARWVEHHLADLPLLLPHGEARSLDEGSGDIIRGLDVNGCWIVMWFVETLPGYRALLDQCLDQVADVVAEREGRMGDRGANLFLGSPGAVTPAHFDRHHNLLLQVQGTKDVTIGVFEDPATAQVEIERHFGQQHNLTRLPERQTTFHLEPGDGLYIPPYAFHWVQGGPEPSVSLSCGFRSPSSERTQLVHVCNVALRRRGLSPSPPGLSQPADRAKAALVQSRRALNRLSAEARRLARSSSFALPLRRAR